MSPKCAWMAVFALAALFAFGCIGGSNSNPGLPTATPSPEASVTPAPTPIHIATPTPTPPPVQAATPRPSPFCGDEVLDPGEQCERGKECPEGFYCEIGCRCTLLFIPTPAPRPTAAPAPLYTPSPTPTPGNVIASCGAEIYTMGDYVVDRDVSAIDYCIRFRDGSGSSTLDCGGHMIGTSAGLNGIIIDAPRVAVRNCRVSAFRVGISISSAGWGSVAENNTFTGTWFSGLNIIGAQNVKALNNSMNRTGEYGVYVVGGEGHEISGNSVTGSRNGIFIVNSINNAVYGNKLTMNTGYGIHVTGSGSAFANNTVCLNVEDFYCEGLETDLGGNVCGVLGHQTCFETLNCTPC
ncbi:MAG: right-handed parallel beta-helix repeat-containing protein [Candidatus ainarchaeum sp.]|nr:right-handed parallel beta-helix repeat-containing protein [Candidatus ainarchaeum sp.]